MTLAREGHGAMVTTGSSREWGMVSLGQFPKEQGVGKGGVATGPLVVHRSNVEGVISTCFREAPLDGT